MYNAVRRNKMNRLSYFLLTIAASIYLFVNGILGLTGSRFWKTDGAFRDMVSAIGIKGDFSNVLVIILSICGIAAGLFLLLALFRVDVPITDFILLAFIVLWIVYIIFVDIIGAISKKPDFMVYLLELSTHLMILGALMSSTRRFGVYSR